MHTSHESIYRYAYIVAVGELKRELVKCLRRSHRVRKPRRRGVTATHGKIPDMVLVDERPAEVESRLIAGHYEGDLILGAGNRSAVGVLVERTTRYTMLCRLEQKDATSVREAFTRRLVDIPAQLRLSLTYDQGKEMTQQKPSPPTSASRSFFAIPTAPGNEGPAKAKTVASAITCQKAPTFPWSPTNSSPPIRKCSTSVPAKSSVGNLRLNVSTTLYQKMFTFSLKCAKPYTKVESITQRKFYYIT
jgi:hypothetical protein